MDKADNTDQGSTELVPRAQTALDKPADQAGRPATEPALPGNVEAEIKSATHMFMVMSALFMLVFGLWASFSRLDIMSIASGEVIPFGNVKRVQHLEGGILKKILIREGEVVKKDQPLAEMESTASESSLNELNIRAASLRINIARLTAELADKDAVEFDKDLLSQQAGLVEEAKNLFKTNREQLENNLKGQDQLMSQRLQSQRELEARIRNEKERRDLLKEQISISNSLLKDDLTSRYQHLELLKQANQLDGEIEENSLALTRAKSALEEQESKKKSMVSAYRKECQGALEQNRRDLDEISERIKKFQDSLKRTVLRAPVDGVVKTLYVVTEGGVVAPGSTILDIVPNDTELIIEAKLPTRDIGYVKPGQKAILRLSSADAYKYSPLEGEVTAISPDTLLNSQGMPYYKVSITTRQTYFGDGESRYTLTPGLQLEVSIQTGERTVLQYIFDPLLMTSREAMTER